MLRNPKKADELQCPTLERDLHFSWLLANPMGFRGLCRALIVSYSMFDACLPSGGLQKPHAHDLTDLMLISVAQLLQAGE